jgi:hypothetical protein
MATTQHATSTADVTGAVGLAEATSNVDKEAGFVDLVRSLPRELCDEVYDLTFTAGFGEVIVIDQ